jgi:hypothetical protein
MRKLILITVLALGTTVARADNGFWYVGAGVVSNSVTGLTGEPLGYGYPLPDLNGTSWKAYGGVRPLKWLGGELDYIDLGSVDSNARGGLLLSHSDGRAVAAYAVGFLPIPLPVVDVFGKVGLARSQLNSTIIVSARGPTWESFSTNGNEFAWGIGVQAHGSMVGARLEYEGFNVPNTNGARVTSLSVLFSF